MFAKVSDLIKQFTKMLTRFVESWKEKPAASQDGYEFNADEV
jgi:hypothetical protein